MPPTPSILVSGDHATVNISMSQEQTKGRKGKGKMGKGISGMGRKKGSGDKRAIGRPNLVPNRRRRSREAPRRELSTPEAQSTGRCVTF
jgi:hypothetical protein